MSTIRRAILLAAGRGSRLRPYTDTVPKPLLQWHGRATLDHIADALVAAGIDELVLVTHHLSSQIDAWASAWPAGRAITVRQMAMRGTADALEAVADAMPEVLDEPFLLVATDYLVSPDFFTALLEFHAAHDADATVSLKRLPSDELSARSSVRFGPDGPEILEIVEKPASGEAPSDVGANLVFVLPPAIMPFVRTVSSSARGEREIQSALNAWLAHGGRCRGLLQEAPPEWSSEDA